MKFRLAAVFLLLAGCGTAPLVTVPPRPTATITSTHVPTLAFTPSSTWTPVVVTVVVTSTPSKTLPPTITPTVTKTATPPPTLTPVVIVMIVTATPSPTASPAPEIFPKRIHLIAYAMQTINLGEVICRSNNTTTLVWRNEVQSRINNFEYLACLERLGIKFAARGLGVRRSAVS